MMFKAQKIDIEEEKDSYVSKPIDIQKSPQPVPKVSPLVLQHARGLFKQFVEAERVKAEDAMEQLIQSIYVNREVFDFVSTASSPVTDPDTVFMYHEDAKEIVHKVFKDDTESALYKFLECIQMPKCKREIVYEGIVQRQPNGHQYNVRVPLFEKGSLQYENKSTGQVKYTSGNQYTPSTADLIIRKDLIECLAPDFTEETHMKQVQNSVLLRKVCGFVIDILESSYDETKIGIELFCLLQRESAYFKAGTHDFNKRVSNPINHVTSTKTYSSINIHLLDLHEKMETIQSRSGVQLKVRILLTFIQTCISCVGHSYLSSFTVSPLTNGRLNTFGMLMFTLDDIISIEVLKFLADILDCDSDYYYKDQGIETDQLITLLALLMCQDKELAKKVLSTDDFKIGFNISIKDISIYASLLRPVLANNSYAKIITYANNGLDYLKVLYRELQNQFNPQAQDPLYSLHLQSGHFVIHQFSTMLSGKVKASNIKDVFCSIQDKKLFIQSFEQYLGAVANVNNSTTSGCSVQQVVEKVYAFYQANQVVIDRECQDTLDTALQMRQPSIILGTIEFCKQCQTRGENRMMPCYVCDCLQPLAQQHTSCSLLKQYARYLGKVSAVSLKCTKDGTMCRSKHQADTILNAAQSIETLIQRKGKSIDFNSKDFIIREAKCCVLCTEKRIQPCYKCYNKNKFKQICQLLHNYAQLLGLDLSGCITACSGATCNTKHSVDEIKKACELLKPFMERNGIDFSIQAIVE